MIGLTGLLFWKRSRLIINMIVFKLVSVLPKKQRTFLIVITSEERIIDVVVSEKGHVGTELAPFKMYRVIFVDILNGSLASVSFFYSDLPNESTTLQLYKDLQDDSIGSESKDVAEESLFVEITMNDRASPFGEEDLRFSIDNQYKVDEEPLVEFTSRDSVSERHSMISGLVNNQLNHYKNLLETEKKLRLKFENISDEMSQKFESKLQSFHSRERSLLQELSISGQQIQHLNSQISDLQIQLKQLTIEKNQMSDLKDLSKQQFDNFKKLDYQNELQHYREILETMDKKWKEFSHNIQTSHDTDPIHFIIREKDEKIANLQNQIQALSKSGTSGDLLIEAEMRKKSLNFQRERDLVYIVEGNKVAVTFDRILMFRSVGAPKTAEEIILSPPSKRSNSSFRSDFKKNSRVPIVTSKSPVKYT